MPQLNILSGNQNLFADVPLQNILIRKGETKDLQLDFFDGEGDDAPMINLQNSSVWCVVQRINAQNQDEGVPSHPLYLNADKTKNYTTGQIDDNISSVIFQFNDTTFADWDPNVAGAPVLGYYIIYWAEGGDFERKTAVLGGEICMGVGLIQPKP